MIPFNKQTAKVYQLMLLQPFIVFNRISKKDKAVLQLHISHIQATQKYRCKKKFLINKHILEFQVLNNKVWYILIKLSMSFEGQTPQNGRGQQQIRSIKRGFLHNILQYNIAVSSYKSKQRQIQQQEETKYADLVNKNLQRQFARKQQQKRKKKIQQKQILKMQYESQIREKQHRKLKQKYLDKNFAKNQQEYLNFRNERRMADLMRIYNRKSYQGLLPQSDIDYSNKQTSSRHVRFKTQPLQNYEQNPESNYKSNFNVQNKSGIYYKDSLDQLQKINRQDIVLKKYSQQYRNI